MSKKFLTVYSPSITEKIVDRDIKPQSKQTKNSPSTKMVMHVMLNSCFVVLLVSLSTLSRASLKKQDKKIRMYEKQCLIEKLYTIPFD